MIYSSFYKELPWYEPCMLSLFGIMFLSFPVIVLVSALQSLCVLVIGAPRHLIPCFLIPAVLTGAPLLIMLLCDYTTIPLLLTAAGVCLLAALAEPVMTIAVIKKRSIVVNRSIQATPNGVADG